jgi:hypothetical protein
MRVHGSCGTSCSGPFLVVGDISDDLEPCRNTGRRTVAVVELGQQSAVGKLVDSEGVAVSNNVVAPFA